MQGGGDEADRSRPREEDPHHRGILCRQVDDRSKRIVFYDDDSNRIEKELDERGKALYLREIRKDIAYFRRFYRKTIFHVELSGAGVAESTEKVKAALEDYSGQ
jgi:hypothetical protein